MQRNTISIIKSVQPLNMTRDKIGDSKLTTKIRSVTAGIKQATSLVSTRKSAILTVYLMRLHLQAQKTKTKKIPTFTEKSLVVITKEKQRDS